MAETHGRSREESRIASSQKEKTSRGLAKVKKKTNSKLRERPSLKKCCTAQREKLRTTGKSEGRGKRSRQRPERRKVGEESERQDEKGCGNGEPGGVWGAHGEERAQGAAGIPALRRSRSEGLGARGPGREGPAPEEVTHKGGRGRGPGRRRPGLSAAGAAGGGRGGGAAPARLSGYK